MQKINSKKICEIVGSESQPAEAEIENISTDSRQIAAGDLFIALKGEKFDGHDYAAQVLQNGAAITDINLKAALRASAKLPPMPWFRLQF